MFRSLVAGIRILFFMFQRRTAFFFLVTLRRADPEPFIRRSVVLYTRLIMKISRTTLHVSGQEHLKALPTGRPVVVVSNHESYLDIPCIFAAVEAPIGFIAKRELTRIPLLGFWILKLGGELIDRRNLRESREVMKRAGRGDANRILLIFPEGTRNRQGEVAPFKAGSLRLAFDRGAVVLPLCVCGGRRKFEGNGYRIKPGPIYVEILPPMDTAAVPLTEKQRFAATLQERIAAAHKRYSGLLSGML